PQYPNRPRHRSAVEVRRRQHRRRPAELVRREHLDLHQPLRANTRRSLSDDVRTGRCRILLLAVLGTQTVATLIAKKLYSEDFSVDEKKTIIDAINTAVPQARLRGGKTLGRLDRRSRQPNHFLSFR